MNQLTKKEWLIAAILTFITVCAWVVFDILHTRAQVEIPPKTQQLIDPVSPDFNYSSLESIPIQAEVGISSP